MRYVICAIALSVILLVNLKPESVFAAKGAYRQYYSNGRTVGRWHYYPRQRAYGIYYKYKPAPNYEGYKYHWAYYYPSRPKYVYYYNPERKKYWGRCPLNPSKDNPYQILPFQDRKEKLEDIPEEAFKPLPYELEVPGKGKQNLDGPMPLIPGSDDGEQMEPPPPPPSE